MSPLKVSPLICSLLLLACGGNDKPAATPSEGGGSSTSGGQGSGGQMSGAGSKMTGEGGGFQSGGGTTSGGGVGHAGMPPTTVAEGKPGEWVNVTPAAIKLGQNDVGGMDNYGVQDVLADPARPGELYAFVCYQGVWRTTDYGTTWTQVYDAENWGKPWGTAIDPNPKRDPTTAPTLYAGVSGALGFLKSTDFGKTWSQTKIPESFGDGHYQEVYSVDVDPYDVDHVLIGFHEAGDIAESVDGGKMWKKHATTGGGSSYYPFFVDTGDAATTAKTWLVIPQEQSQANTLHTTDGGAKFTDLGKFQHHHGSAQIHSVPGGPVFMAAMQPSGIFKSSDRGATWDSVSELSDGVVTATDKTLYASVGRGWGKPEEPLEAQMATAPLEGGTNWTAMASPDGMVDGSKRIAVTKDKQHNIVVAGNWHAGIWRYIEP